MLLGIDIPEEKLLSMTDKEKLALLDAAYGRTKQIRYRALNARKKLEILRIPKEYAFTILTDKEIGYLHALELGFLS